MIFTALANTVGSSAKMAVAVSTMVVMAEVEPLALNWVKAASVIACAAVAVETVKFVANLTAEAAVLVRMSVAEPVMMKVPLPAEKVFCPAKITAFAIVTVFEPVRVIEVAKERPDKLLIRDSALPSTLNCAPAAIVGLRPEILAMSAAVIAALEPAI